MKRFLPAIFLWFASAVVSNAAEITVRSGAHDGFARLVLDVPRETEWSVQQDTDQATISIADHAGGFDIASVFERIDQTYVRAVSSEAGTLNIAFNCKCAAEVFRSGASMIVVDISQTEGLAEVSTASEISFGLEFVGTTRLAFDPAEKPPTLNTEAQTPTIDFAENSREPSTATPSADIASTSRTADLESLRQAQEKLAERISFAATTGVLRPNNQGIDLPGAEARPQINTQIFDSSVQLLDDEVGIGPIGGNLRITSSNDVPSDGIDQIQASTTLGVRCIDPALVRVQDWGDDAGFAKSVSNLRRDLYSEFDVLNPEVATDLARLYLHFGFGAEARQILAMIDQPTQSTAPLASIADVMEFGSAKPDNYIESFLDCDSDVALWAILAKQDLQPSDTINSDAAIRSLSSLPLHLRRFVAPALSKKLLAYGDQDAAAAALRGLERTSEPLQSAGAMAKADIELAQGDVAVAQDRLKGIVESNDQQSAQALIRYVDTHLDAEVAIDDDVATLVEAYALEFRDDPLGQELRRTHVLALAKSEQFDAAFAALDRMRPSGNAGLADRLESPLIELLSKTADDATFLEHAFAAITSHPQDLSPQARSLLTERLIELGFLSEAEHLMTASGETLTPQHRLLRARISMGLSRPREALAFLGNLEGEVAERLRAQANAHAGEYGMAYTLFSEMNAGPDQLQSAWLSDDWLVLIEPTEPVLGPAVTVATSALDNSGDLNGMLGRTEDALDESANARDVIRQLLTMDAVSQLPEG
ncbi:hypothetical protein [uncultured Tateyamaria sp.]|uniref:hypothetical protein n=1 Tax=uncultured Tateyamaria sp. TaxID=455651 RepID=UPI002618D168|nr:hypothetical protein [uncultured Tateyamaria sp.]